MQFNYEMKTRVLFGKNCIEDNRALFTSIGNKAMIVTGKRSGKESGALDAVTGVLEKLSIQFIIYDKILNNPDLDNISDAKQIARSFMPDFIIGIGGGSPLDASKAVAVLAVNDIEPVELFKNQFTIKPLPVIAVPTTAGTGSEVTPYSILTRKDISTKMSFGTSDTFPLIAFMDPLYTMSMSKEVTVNTAVDALSHAIEGYISKRSTPLSDALAEEAIGAFGECLDSLLNSSFNYNLREKMLYMAMLGGMVIAQTGTTIVHGMGYSLTYFKGLPHGLANGILMKEYLKFNFECAADKINNILKLLKVKDIDELGHKFDKLLKTDVSVNDDELKLFAGLAMKQRSTSYNIRQVTEADMVKIMLDSIKKGRQ